MDHASVTELLVAVALVGWSLLSVGAASHLRHFESLVDQLGNHVALDRPRSVRLSRSRLLARVLLLTEAAAALAVPIVLAFGSPSLRTGVGIIGGLIGAAFTTWIGRLLLVGSDLPCACSSSDRPASVWSLVRSIPVMGMVAMAFLGSRELPPNWLALALVALAVGQALYVLPDAMSWPDFSRRMIASVKVAGARS